MEEVNTNEKIKKNSGKKKTIRNLIIIILIGIFTGVSLGMYYISNQIDPNRYNIDTNLLTDDVEEIRKESIGKSPSELGATKSCVLAFDTTFNYQKLRIISEGAVTASVGPIKVKQTINAKTMRIENDFYYENVSVSNFVKALNRYYVNGNDIKHYTGNLNNNIVTWNTSTENTGDNDVKTLDDYKAKFGSSFNEYMTYIVSSKTVINESSVEINGDGNYTFTLTLDKTKSVVNYVKNMKATGGLEEYPDFTSDPVIKLTIDSNYRIIEFVSKENYNAKMGVTAVSEGVLTNTFTYDGEFTFPDLTDKTII